MEWTGPMKHALQYYEEQGRKFGAGDIVNHPILSEAAYDYAINYDGNFGYMLFRRRQLQMGASFRPVEAKGVLNCLVAEARFKGISADADSVVTVPEVQNDYYGTDEVKQVIPDGTYTIVWDDEGKDYTSIRLKTAKKMRGVRPGVQTIAYPTQGGKFIKFGFASAEKFRPWKSFVDHNNIVAAVTQLLSTPDDYETYGMAYAMQSGHCYRCGKQLRVPASLYRGLGPDCAQMVAQREFGG